MTDPKRRRLLKAGGALLAAGSLPLSLVELAFGKDRREHFSFAYLSDSHITHVRGREFVRNWDRGLIRAVAESNLLDPRPDFIFYGGDIAQLGKPEEIDHGLEILSALRGEVHHVMGEHDYYLDLGEHWRKRLGPDHYSFDHKGVHFVVLNSILTFDDWTYHRWSSAAERMHQMARLDNPQGSPFMVGESQRAWLKKDLDTVSHDTPVVVFSHSPLQKIYKGWNFWTDDAEQVQALLQPFDKVTVLYGHVHQIQYNQIGNISFHAAMATAWPWPYPSSYRQQAAYLPKLTVNMNRADPFFERDATGWQFIDLDSGKVDVHYLLPGNRNRVVAWDGKAGHPVDTRYQAEADRIPPQTHY
ncbi:MAG TPA: serine/threonine protein phosphatase [Gammaproteobacteria bacterium]|nr:serine/threonine protein phosphatase [Gammaproteobacteria bacterium]